MDTSHLDSDLPRFVDGTKLDQRLTTSSQLNRNNSLRLIRAIPYVGYSYDSGLSETTPPTPSARQKLRTIKNIRLLKKSLGRVALERSSF
jgi:hypothetical protein